MSLTGDPRDSCVVCHQQVVEIDCFGHRIAIIDHHENSGFRWCKVHGRNVKVNLGAT